MTERSARSHLLSCGEAMGDTCTKLDQKIAHHGNIAVRITDKQTLDGIARLIKEMTDTKATLHCEPKEK